jgi:hypothetical protein
MANLYVLDGPPTNVQIEETGDATHCHFVRQVFKD